MAREMEDICFLPLLMCVRTVPTYTHITISKSFFFFCLATGLFLEDAFFLDLGFYSLEVGVVLAFFKGVAFVSALVGAPPGFPSALVEFDEQMPTSIPPSDGDPGCLESFNILVRLGIGFRIVTTHDATNKQNSNRQRQRHTDASVFCCIPQITV